jgi:fructuronate reductase
MTQRPRLSNLTLPDLPLRIGRPGYDRHQLKTGIVHLGVGAFHRAHQAVMTEAVIASGDMRWGIAGASLRSPDTRDALHPQDNLYTVAVRDAGVEDMQIVGALTRTLVAPDDPRKLIDLMAAPETRIVSLTVTEKGYCHDPATGELNENHLDILHDLANPAAPRSMPGYVAAALALRHARGLPPFTLLSCDNLPANGRVLKRVVQRMASLRDPELGNRLADTLVSPCTMVDRIVPATTDADRAQVSAAIGLHDAWPVMTEPFTQWVIEDDFADGRPDWDLAGATFANDVAPYEFMKLRLLNGAHSSLAYLGLSLGHETVAEATRDPRMTRFLEALWREIIPSIPAPGGVDLQAYTADLLKRFQNLSIRHRLAQIAMDGSQKLPQRLLGTIRDNLAAGRPIRHLVIALAAFALHASGRDAGGQPVEVKDPLQDQLASCLAGVRHDPAGAIDKLLGVRAIFDESLARDAAFRDALERAVRDIATPSGPFVL